MPLITCPKCHGRVSRGSWEIITHCPSCKEEWPVAPDAPRRAKSAIATKAAAFCILSCLPLAGMISAIAAAHCTVTLMVAGLCAWLCLAGIVLGIFSAFWGYLALRSKKTALGAIAMLAGIVLGVAAPSMIVWWVAGGWNDASSRQEMASLAQSMQEYTHKTGYYPPTKFADGSGPKDGPTASKTLAQMYLPAPSASPEGSGGDYIYLPSSPLIRSSTIINCPLLAWPAPQIPFTGGDAGTLLLAEKEQNHRRFRMCMTTDLVARELTPRQFDALLALPQNM